MNELLDFTNKFVQTRTENHNQKRWMTSAIEGAGMHMADQEVCGTTGCVAGWGAIFGGYFQVRPYVNDDGDTVYDEVVDPANGTTMHMRDAARVEFGLTEEQAWYLFSPSNDREAIQEMVDAIQANPNASLRVFHRAATDRYLNRVSLA